MEEPSSRQHPFDGERGALPTTVHPTRLIFQLKKRKKKKMEIT